MDRHFCEVVPVYMRPQSMVDEQACFGVVVRCPTANFYGYRLAQGDEAAIARITSFFPRAGRAGLERAMTWAAQDIEYTFDRERNQGDKGAWHCRKVGDGANIKLRAPKTPMNQSFQVSREDSGLDQRGLSPRS